MPYLLLFGLSNVSVIYHMSATYLNSLLESLKNKADGSIKQVVVDVQAL